MPSRSSKRLRTVVVALSLAALVACGSDDGDPKATETPPPPGGDSAPPTTSSAQTGPTGCQARGAPASSEQAAQCLYAAWKEGNPERAAAVATPEAVSSLFREKWSPPDAAFEPASPTTRPTVALARTTNPAPRTWWTLRQQAGACG